jgi:hypothetical protein
MPPKVYPKCTERVYPGIGSGYVDIKVYPEGIPKHRTGVCGYTLDYAPVVYRGYTSYRVYLPDVEFARIQ